MLPGFDDFNAKNNKKNLPDCNEYMHNDELRNTLKFSQLSRYANKQATTKLPRDVYKRQEQHLEFFDFHNAYILSVQI